MTTPLNIIERACRLARLAAEQQPIDDYKIQRGLEVLNDMIREWGNSENYIPLQTLLTLDLVNNQQTYTVGLNTNSVTYDLNSAPIINILECNIIDQNNSNKGYYKVEVITELMYSNIFYRQTQSIPEWVLLRLYPNYTELRFQSVPYGGLTCEMLSKQQMQPVANTALSVPIDGLPGFANRAMKYYVARELMIIFGKEASPDFIQEYDRAIQAYLDNNIGVDPYVKHDVQLNGAARYGTYYGIFY